MALRILQRKTHNLSFECRKLQYRWHPWYGCDVLTRKAGGENAATAYFCKLPEMGDDAALIELPKWMFDAAQCATMRIEDRAYADFEALRLLKTTIADLCASKGPAVGATTVPVPEAN